MIDKKLRDKINKYLIEKDATAKIFEKPDFDHSIIGISEDNRIVYSIDSMVEEYMSDNNCSYDDAIEFLEYNTFRSIDYLTEGPIIIRVTKDKLLED